jgi:hypothetical protein
VKVTGEPDSPELVAVRVLVPMADPSVQLPTCARPDELVVTDDVPNEPPPAVIAKVTLTPLTGLLLASLTTTHGGVPTAVLTGADWDVDENAAICVAVPTVPVAIKITGEPVSVPLVAVSVLVPAVGPMVQLPTVAIPAEFVVADAELTVPPPPITVKVTLTPLTGLPLASLTMTLGGVATAVLTAAFWLVTEFGSIWVAAAAT